MNRPERRREMHLVKKEIENGDIDPAIALEILPQKIAERKKIITSLALDRSVAFEDSPESPEVAEFDKSLAAQKRYLAIYEARLEGVRRAINGE